MRVKRVTANIETSNIGKADGFYHDVLGLECVMDLGWIQTYGSDTDTILLSTYGSYYIS